MRFSMAASCSIVLPSAASVLRTASFCRSIACWIWRNFVFCSPGLTAAEEAAQPGRILRQRSAGKMIKTAACSHGLLLRTVIPRDRVGDKKTSQNSEADAGCQPAPHDFLGEEDRWRKPRKGESE